MTIIQIEPSEGTQFHPMESQSHRTSCWMDGYIAVPADLLQSLQAGYGHGALQIEKGQLLGFTPIALPPSEPAEPTAEEDVDSMLISLEYRLVLLELGLV